MQSSRESREQLSWLCLGRLKGSSLDLLCIAPVGPPLTVFIEMCIGTPDRHVARNE